MRELVCNGQLWALRQIAQAFSSNSLMNTMEMTAAIQYILTAARSLGSQDYYKKSRMMILGLAGVLFWKTSRHRQNGISYVPKKIFTWMLREARGGLKATVGNRVTTRLSLHPHSFLFFSVSFSYSLVFHSSLCSKACQHILDIVGLSQADVRRTYLYLFGSQSLLLFHENKPKDNRYIKTLKILLATTIGQPHYITEIH